MFFENEPCLKIITVITINIIVVIVIDIFKATL